MVEQKNILLVTNSTTEGEIALIQEAFIRNKNQSKQQGLELKLNLVHVIPHLPTCYFNIPSMVVLTEHYYEEAMQALTSIGQLLNVTKKDQWLITGKIKTEVPRLADKLNTDFILASSTTIQDLHSSSSFPFVKKLRNSTPIRSISSLIAATEC